MKVLIVDDSTSKLAEITSLISSVSESFEIESCEDCIGCLIKLKNKYDLIIIDLFLPLRPGEDPVTNGGQHIIEQITRDKNLKPPTYILGLTQYDELIDSFHLIWKAIKYDPTSITWKKSIREALIYVSRQYSSDDRIILDKVPTIFVEGKIDEVIVSESLRLFYPDHVEKIKIKSDTGAGADWVTRQLIIWANSFPKDVNKRHIKCVGLYDNDSKGRDSINELNRVIATDSAQANYFKTVLYTPTYAKHLIPLFKKGLKPPIELEQMFDYTFLLHAKNQLWLETRTDLDSFLAEPKGWNKMNMSLSQHLQSLGITEQEDVYLMKVKNDCKQNFCNYILSLPDHEKRKGLYSFSLMFDDIIKILYQ